MKLLILSMALGQMLQGNLQSMDTTAELDAKTRQMQMQGRFVPEIKVPVQRAPIAEVQPTYGVLGARYDPRNGKIWQILPGSDLERFPFIRVGDLFVSPYPSCTRPMGAIGQYVRLQVLTQAKTNSGYAGGHLQTVMVRLQDPRRITVIPTVNRINNPEYYGNVDRMNYGY